VRVTVVPPYGEGCIGSDGEQGSEIVRPSRPILLSNHLSDDAKSGSVHLHLAHN